MNKWIKCSERLPEIGVEVLKYEKGHISTGKIKNQNEGSYYREEDNSRWIPSPPSLVWESSCEDCDYYFENPSHWMELPEEPDIK